MELNYGALIGGVAVAASLLVFLVCFALSGVGPHCCRLLYKHCPRRSGAKSTEAHGVAPAVLQLRPPQSLANIGAPVPTTSPCLVQLPAVLAIGKAKRPQPSKPPQAHLCAAARVPADGGAPTGVTSAPNPARPLDSTGVADWRLSPPATVPAPAQQQQPQEQQQLPPPQLRVCPESLRLIPQGSFGLTLPQKRRYAIESAGSGKVLSRPGAHLTRSSPLLLLVPGSRRGISGMQLSLSTIRDCSASMSIPPDCLYAAAAASASSVDAHCQDEQRGEAFSAQTATPAGTAAAVVLEGIPPSPSAAGTSLRAQIGSAYGHLPLPMLPYPLPPPKQRSNASSSDCNDWSPPRPLPALAAGAKGGVAAIVWASEDGDVTILDLQEASTAAAVAARSSHEFVSGDNGRGLGSVSEDRSTSF